MIKISKFSFIAFVFILLISVLSNLILIYQNIERGRVVRVVDGDSFQMKDGRRIRLLGIDAPDRSRCLYNEAKERLKELILNKRVSLTDIVTDDYGRILANVFVCNVPDSLLADKIFLLRKDSTASAIFPINLFVNKILVGEGLARFSYVSSPYYEELKDAANKAKAEKIGIYSEACRSFFPKSECIIKGNINSSGERFYHLPYCLHYKEVIVDTAFGDQWFCSEEEASQAGFRKAGGC